MEVTPGEALGAHRGCVVLSGPQEAASALGTSVSSAMRGAPSSRGGLGTQEGEQDPRVALASPILTAERWRLWLSLGQSAPAGWSEGGSGAALSWLPSSGGSMTPTQRPAGPLGHGGGQPAPRLPFAKDLFPAALSRSVAGSWWGPGLVPDPDWR